MPPEWEEMHSAGMRTAFRFPLRPRMADEQRTWLADALVNLPITTLVFLKHFRRIEFAIHRGAERREFAWTVTRERLNEDLDKVATGLETEMYRVVLSPDQGNLEEFLLAHDGNIAIGEYRGGLDEFSWEGVEYSEISVAARIEQVRPVPLVPGWRKLHVFLPSGEPCPYHLLISGAFSSNLSRQEIRIEPDERNYNRFLLRHAARLVRDSLLPSLFQRGASVSDVLRLLGRGVPAGAPASTSAAQAVYDEVRVALQGLPSYIVNEGERAPRAWAGDGLRPPHRQ